MAVASAVHLSSSQCANSSLNPKAPLYSSRSLATALSPLLSSLPLQRASDVHVLSVSEGGGGKTEEEAASVDGLLFSLLRRAPSLPLSLFLFYPMRSEFGMPASGRGESRLERLEERGERPAKPLSVGNTTNKQQHVEMKRCTATTR